MHIIKETVADVLRKQRLKAQLTQEELSIKSDISARYIQKLEAGEQLPSFATLFKLAKALEIKPSTIINAAWEAWLKQQNTTH